ncbi:MAG: ribosomal protein S18-alanine N-acetyltransferase [Gammaproteobacteria bacterium]|nr:ribosomal protein S18-alanine N-acetyltransferase [Gammaproteobacteria bacterium]
MNKQFECTKLSLEDLPKIIEIEQSAHVSPWTSGVIKDSLKQYECWGLKNNDELIGYIFFTLRTGECEILNLCIAPKHQCHGYGTTLLTAILNHAKHQKIKMAFLEVRNSNQQALKLYDKLGFNETGIRKNYYPTKSGRENAILLAKDLS